MSNFRPFRVASTPRPDGSVLLAWSPQALALSAGAANIGAATTTQVPNVTDWLPVWAAARPEQVCLAERDETGAWRLLSYRETWRCVQAIAAALLARSAEGDPSAPVIAIVAPNSVRQALLTFAALYAGLPVAPVSPAYATRRAIPRG